jgi:transcriptional regulator with XRE-family HTH domain
MDWKKCITDLQAAGLSIDQIADGIGVSGNAVREVVAGRTKAPRADAAIKLLGLCTTHRVLPGSRDPQPEVPGDSIVVPFEAPP